MSKAFIKFKKIAIPSSVTSIGESTFSECSSLTQITIPSSVTSIGKSAFEHCSSLTQITIPSSVNSTGDSAFRGCLSFKTFTILSSDKSFDSEPSEFQLNCMLIKYEIQESSSKEEKERINKLIEEIKTYELDFKLREGNEPIPDGCVCVKMVPVGRTVFIKLKPSLTVLNLKEFITHNITGHDIDVIHLI